MAIYQDKSTRPVSASDEIPLIMATIPPRDDRAGMKITPPALLRVDASTSTSSGGSSHRSLQKETVEALNKNGHAYE